MKNTQKYLDQSLDIESRISDLLDKLTIDEKISLIRGKDFWTTNPIQRLNIPSFGMTTIYTNIDNSVQLENKQENTICRAFTDNGATILENDLLVVTFNGSGQITQILDKQTGMQYADGLCNDFKMYKISIC